MPYKPTGRPNGRPRKHPLPVEAAPEPKAIEPALMPRARRRFRQIAEALNPSPFLVVYDGRGRPRHKPRHSSVKV